MPAVTGLILAVVIATVVIGPGDDEAGPTDIDAQLRLQLHAYYEALRAGDTQTACKLLAAETRTQLEQERGVTCEDAINGVESSPFELGRTRIRKRAGLAAIRLYPTYFDRTVAVLRWAVLKLEDSEWRVAGFTPARTPRGAFRSVRRGQHKITVR